MQKTMTRQYFGTDGIRGEVGGSLINPSFALRLGYAAGKILAQQNSASGRKPVVLIGKDTRVSGYMLESALEAGLSAAGVDVLLAGPMPTPAIAYLTKTLRLSAGIVISASHNPYQDNGIKFFSSEGYKLPDEVELEIESQLSQPIACVASSLLGKARRLNDAAGRYIEFCKRAFPFSLNLKGLTLVIDAAHGAAYHIAPAVFEELGATVVTMGVQPDGTNINAGVGATAPQALIKKVQEVSADYGIALDGDADRILMVDQHGRIYGGDELLYAIVQDYHLNVESVPGVVGTVMSNLGVEKAFLAKNMQFVRSAVGDRYVLEKMLENDWYFGGENSGHLVCRHFHTTGDGTLAALLVLTAIQRARASLAELTQDITLYPQILHNIALSPTLDWKNNTKFQTAQDSAQNLLQQKGRILIRPSGTEPKLRIMVEAETQELAENALEILLKGIQDA